MQSGQRVTSLDELQDIDELCVVEGPGQGSMMNNLSTEANLRSGLSVASSSSDVIYKTPENRKLSIHELRGSLSPPGATPEDDEGKYRGRDPIKKLLKRLLPSIFGAPGLPVTADDVKGDGLSSWASSAVSFGRRRKTQGKRSTRSMCLVLFFVSFFVSLVLFQSVFWRHRTQLEVSIF